MPSARLAIVSLLVVPLAWAGPGAALTLAGPGAPFDIGRRFEALEPLEIWSGGPSSAFGQFFSQSVGTLDQGATYVISDLRRVPTFEGDQIWVAVEPEVAAESWPADCVKSGCWTMIGVENPYSPPQAFPSARPLDEPGDAPPTEP